MEVSILSRKNVDLQSDDRLDLLDYLENVNGKYIDPVVTNFASHCGVMRSKYWIKDDERITPSFVMEGYGKNGNESSISFYEPGSIFIRVRPLIYFDYNDSLFKKLCESVKDELVINGNPIGLVTYGKYPKSFSNVSDKELYDLKTSDKLKKTGFTYTAPEEEHHGFYMSNIDEYLYNGKRCVLLGDRWFNVEDIEWVINKRTHMMLSKDIILGNIVFSNDREVDLFKESDLYRFLNNNFLQEISESYLPEDYKEILIDTLEKLKKISENYKEEMIKLINKDSKEYSTEDIINYHNMTKLIKKL